MRLSIQRQGVRTKFPQELSNSLASCSKLCDLFGTVLKFASGVASAKLYLFRPASTELAQLEH